MHRPVLSPMLCLCLSAVFADFIRAEEGKSTRLTEQGCREFATKLVEAIESQDLDKCGGFYNVNALVESILGKLEFKYVPAAQVIEVWQKRFRESHALYRDLVASVAEGGSIEVLYVNPEERTRNVVLRVLTAEESLQYQALTLASSNVGSLAIIDVHAIPAGSLKDLLRDFVARFAPHEGADGKIVKEAPNAEQLIYDKRVLASMQQHLQKEGYLDVVHNYSFLSTDLKSDRYALLLVLRASVAAVCQTAPDGNFAQALDKSVLRFAGDYRKKFPDDPTVDVLLLERHLHFEKFDEAQQSINALDQWVGGDPYLNTVRARVYLQRGDVERARHTAEKSLNECPNILPPYVAIAEIASKQGDADRVSEVAATASQKFGVNIREMILNDGQSTQTE